MTIFADSEIAPLKRVIVHSPDAGIARVLPSRAEEMLFDDIVAHDQMVKEHDLFKAVLRCLVDEVIEIDDLILDGLRADAANKRELIDLLVHYEDLPKSYTDRFLDMADERLLEVLITGQDSQTDINYFDPIPNFIFTRDIAVTVKDHIIALKASKKARYRENLLTRFALLSDNGFIDNEKVINLNELEEFPPSDRGEKVTIEGGDVMMFNKDYVLIGCSERTTNHAFDSVKRALFEKGLVKNVVQVIIPNDRYCMHIDTLFTRISHDELICYKPIAIDGKSSVIHVHRSDGTVVNYPTLEVFLKSEINPEFKLIKSGGGISPYQEREQWTDGCNLVAIRPGVAISYDRNIKTADALRAHGYEIIPAQEFVDQYSKEDLPEGKKIIIALDSGELSRARGGSHCMTCPVLREAM